MARKTHLVRGLREGATVTLCGRDVQSVTLIGHNEIVDSATCNVCQRADDALQIREHEKDRKAAGAKPGEWF